jgi:hypothetical protein
LGHLANDGGSYARHAIARTGIPNTRSRQKLCTSRAHEGEEMSGQISAATERALKLVLKGWTPYAAAKKEGIALSTIYRALKREKEKRK